MNPSRLFIARPVATTLLTIGVALAGIMAFALLPVSPLPQVDFPTINVSASLPGASPETMAATVATPLERALGRIAGVSEMTSSSSLGSSNITLQFDLNRDIDGAARDVQAAINAARDLLPTGLPSNPTYRKVNPADAPIMILAMTSDTLTQSQMFDAADTILAQKIAQVQGVGNVNVGGGARPAVRVELNPSQLNNAGISLESVRNAIASTNANRPKGVLDDGANAWQIYANDQAKTAVEYRPLIVAYQNGAPVRLGDVSTVIDSNQDLRNAGLANGKPAVLIIISRQPNANIIETVDRVKAMIPQFKASIPAAIDLQLMFDRTPTIRASLHDTETTLLLSVALVILVVYLFLGSARAALIPSVAVPVSLIGTFGAMYLLDYSLDIFSLMALTIATGFVVDDAIVVLENAQRHIENGMTAVRGRVEGRAGGRLHGAVDEHLADRGLHPDPADGRHRRPALPRVRRHAVGRDRRVAARLADDDADDVRVPPQGPDGRRAAAAPQRVAARDGRLRPPRPATHRRMERARDRGRHARLRAVADVGARRRAADDPDPRRDDRAQRLPLLDRAEGLLPAAGHGAHGRRGRRGPGDLVPGDEDEARRAS